MASSKPFLTAEWRYLAMLSYEIDPAVLRSAVPEGTELDSWAGKTLVSVVGFWFGGTRVLGWPIPYHQEFEEVNLRFYVRRESPEGLRRGVVFVKEIVPRRMVVAVARWVYGEHYVSMPMRHRFDLEGDALGPGSAIQYAWCHRGRWDHLRVATTGLPQPALAQSEEEFITEHYWGYTARPGGGTREYRVEHPRWRVWRVGEASFRCDVGALYGQAFVEPLSAPPVSALLAEGSPVIVRRPEQLT